MQPKIVDLWIGKWFDLFLQWLIYFKPLTGKVESGFAIKSWAIRWIYITIRCQKPWNFSEVIRMNCLRWKICIMSSNGVEICHFWWHHCFHISKYQIDEEAKNDEKSVDNFIDELSDANRLDYNQRINHAIGENISFNWYRKLNRNEWCIENELLK